MSILDDTVKVNLTNLSYNINVYDTSLGHRWIEALRDNLKNKRILEKNFCFLGYADSKRNLKFMCEELNKSIAQINAFSFNPPYEHINNFIVDDFQYSALDYPVGREIDGDFPGLKLKHDACNQLHRYFEELQGTAWELSPYYRQADTDTKYAIRQLNNLCHEIETWVLSNRKSVVNPDWIRPSQITTFLHSPRHDLHEQDFELFKQNRYRRELGGVYLHWSQVGKTLWEVFNDEGAPKMTEALCSEINHQKFYSGEFDVEWGQTVDEDTFDWKRKEMDDYRAWLKENNYDWEDAKLSLGYIKIGQVDLKKTFDNASFQEIYNTMTNNLDITSIKIVGLDSVECDYPYSLDSEDWQSIQKEAMLPGYRHSQKQNT
jgi:hypothetical protein